MESSDGQLLPLKYIMGMASKVAPRDFNTSDAIGRAKSIGLTPIFTGDQILRDIALVQADRTTDSTTKEQLILARVGQGKFRKALCLEQASCFVTGYAELKLLVASHILPWKSSNNEQRLDPRNGILLIPQLDRAFDLGFISFGEDGTILLSPALSNPAALGIRSGMKLTALSGRQKYLEYHRKHVLKKGGA